MIYIKEYYKFSFLSKIEDAFGVGDNQIIRGIIKKLNNNIEILKVNVYEDNHLYDYIESHYQFMIDDFRIESYESFDIQGNDRYVKVDGIKLKCTRYLANKLFNTVNILFNNGNKNRVEKTEFIDDISPDIIRKDARINFN